MTEGLKPVLQAQILTLIFRSGSQQLVGPNTFSGRENAPGHVQVHRKIGCYPASKVGLFRCFGTPQNRSTMTK